MPKYLPVAEARNLGVVHEINRLLLHPIGMALEVRRDEETGEEYLAGFQDHREEPGGLYFDENTISREKIDNMFNMMREALQERMEICGWWIQPPPPRSE